MGNAFFEQPILNSPYEYPGRHWEFDDTGKPTHQIIDTRQKAEFITPVPKHKKPGNLLYVACTRARDHLFVSGVDPASEFLEDLCL